MGAIYQTVGLICQRLVQRNWYRLICQPVNGRVVATLSNNWWVYMRRDGLSVDLPEMVGVGVR
jgi:hypothetical protein